MPWVSGAVAVLSDASSYVEQVPAHADLSAAQKQKLRHSNHQPFLGTTSQHL